ncbi:hypothetical protein TrRE_jg4800, partial [Triparma retinervis]
MGMVLVENKGKRGANVSLGSRISTVIASRRTASLSSALESPPVPAVSSPPQKPRVKDFVNEMGMSADGYDYGSHLRATDPSRIYSRNGGFIDPSEDSLGKRIGTDPSLDRGEVERHLDSITLTTKGMDLDMREQLFGEDFSFEGDMEILDDFCEVADKEVLDEAELRERGYIRGGGTGGGG